MECPRYRTDQEIQEVVKRFEQCEFKLEEFTHARHLTVAAWYLSEFNPEESLSRMRIGLERFIQHHGKQGYHETITRFWMELIGSFLQCAPEGCPFRETVNEVIVRYGTKEILFEYYTWERVLSDIARREWIEPDLKSIPSIHAPPFSTKASRRENPIIDLLR